MGFRHKIKEIVTEAANRFADAMKNKYGDYITGPAEPVVNKVRNQYLMELLIKIPKDTRIMHQCRLDIFENIAILHNEKRFRSVVIVPDVDVM